MGYNGSLDFLNMIKNSTPPAQNDRAERRKDKKALEIADFTPDKSDEEPSEAAPSEEAPKAQYIAVIDTETNWHNEVMSIGIALADADSFKCLDKKYYIIEPECLVGGYFSSALSLNGLTSVNCRRDEAMRDICSYLQEKCVTKILAYNAAFDLGHLPELSGFEWFDIMRLAAYRQYNRAIPESLPCCKTGRLKSNYGVEAIMKLLTGDGTYKETHNAAFDAVDELKIVELLGLGLDAYEIARIQGG